jgi:hypothetical protein
MKRLPGYTYDGRRMVMSDGKGKPTQDRDKATGYGYHKDDLPIHGGGCGTATKNGNGVHKQNGSER